MDTPSRQLLCLAEDLNSNMPLRPGDFRLETSRYTIIFGATEGPHGTVVQRFRMAQDEVPQTLAEIRERMRKEGRTEALFEVGPSATPADLPAQLHALGVAPFALEPQTVSLLLSNPAPDFLPPWPDSVRIKRVEDFDSYRESQRVFWQCFGYTPDDFETAVRKDYDCYQGSPLWTRFSASIEGAIVGAGDVVFTPEAAVLCGGATLPSYRSHGVYRALLSARYEEACRRGTPHLLTQAGHMSQPILLRLGFRPLCTVKIFHDRL
ncbi:MAG: GNAT family N-acetyltransferase [Myxococcales bacterium]|nr:GNAT family N-acetyltransferase [Myxococcales bacterium]